MRRVVIAVVLFALVSLLLLYRTELQDFAAHGTGDAAPAKATDSKSGSKDGSGKAGAVSAVTVSTATSGSLPIVRQTIGSIVPLASTALGSPIAGIVAEVLVKDGATVAAGDLLVQFDDRTIKANIRRDQSLLAKDQATLDDANVTLQRVEKLNTSGIDTQQQYGDAVSAAKQAAAAIEVDNATLAADNVLLSQTQIRAPFDGQLGAILVSPGAYMPAGGQVAVLTQMKPVFAAFTLPEPDLDLARAAMAAGQLTVSVLPTLRQNDDPAGSGHVVFIDNAIDAASGTFTLRAQLANEALAFWPGQSLSVTVTAGTRDGLVIVPSVAVQPQGDDYICFVVRPDQTVEVRKVTLALSVGDMAGIASGLKAGEAVVTEGQAGLATGSRVVASAAKGATP